MKNKKANNQTSNRKGSKKSVAAVVIAAVGIAALGTAVVGCGEKEVKKFNVDLFSNLTTVDGLIGEGEYKQGEKITVTAEDVLGYTFTGWYKNGENVWSGKEYSFVVDGECKLEARYRANEVEILLVTKGQGNITIGDEAEMATARTDDRVTVTASPQTGYYCDNLTYTIGEQGEVEQVNGSSIDIPAFAQDENNSIKLYVIAEFKEIPTADEVFTDGIFNYRANTKEGVTTLEITGLNDGVKNTITDLTIPAQGRLGRFGAGWDVVAIADGKLSTPTPNAALYPTSGAFFGLRNIQRVHFDERNCKLKYIGHGAFADTGIREIVLPASVEEVGQFAFFTCNKLTKADFSQSKVTTIARGTFNARYTKSTPNAEKNDIGPSYSLKEFVAPAGLTTIEGLAFKNTGLTKLDLSNTEVTSIGEEAFMGCGNMLTAHMPTIAEEDFATADAVSFGENAFALCSTMYVFEAKKVSGPVNMFADCVSLVEVVSYDENNWNDVTAWGITNGFAQVVKATQLRENGDFIVRVTEIEGEQTTVKYEIIKCIELDADGKINFTNLDLSQVDEDVKVEVVVGPGLLDGMKKHTISEDPSEEAAGDVVHELEDLRNSLTGVVFSSAITEIGDYAFRGFDEIVTLDLSECVNLTRIGKFAFAHCRGILGRIFMPKATEIIDGKEYNNVTEIGAGAFARVTKASAIDLSQCRFTTLGYAQDEKDKNGTYYGMFQESKAFYEIKLPETLTTIQDQAFSRCAKLISLTIPSRVEVISENAFKQVAAAYSACASLVEVVYDGDATEALVTALSQGTSQVNMGNMQPFPVRIIKFEDGNEDGINDNSNIKVFGGSYYFYKCDNKWYFIGKRAIEDTFLYSVDLSVVDTALTNEGISSYTIPAYVFNDEGQIKEFKFSTGITTYVDANAFNKFAFYYVATGTEEDFSMHITNKVVSFDSTSLKDFMGKDWVDQVTLIVDSAVAFEAMTVAGDLKYVDEIRVLTSVYEASENAVLKDATKYTATVDGDYTVITPVVA